MKREQEIQELFEIKQKFLREIPHPTLINKYFKMTGSNLTEGLVFDSLKLVDELQELELTVFLTHYLEDLMKLKLALSNASEKITLNGLIERVFYVQFNLLWKLASYLPEEDVLEEDVKVSTSIDPHLILKFVKERNLQEKEIKGYLCAELAGNDKNESPVLIDFIRARKIIRNGR